LRTAGLACVGAGGADLLVLPAAGPFGAALAEHLVVGGREALAPLLVGDGQGIGARADRFGGHRSCLRSAAPRASRWCAGCSHPAEDGERGVHSLDPSAWIGCVP